MYKSLHSLFFSLMILISATFSDAAGVKIFNYHPKTGEYISEQEARPNPVTAGEYLIPAHATTTAPPESTPGKARVFSGVEWSQADDHRGKTIWKTDRSNESEKISSIGPIPSGWTDQAPPDNESKWDGSAWIPDMDTINARTAEEARQAAKAQAIIDNLPTWAEVDQAVTNISNLADAKAFIRKLARIVYWLAKDKQN